jgi:hypothetical protein
MIWLRNLIGGMIFFDFFLVENLSKHAGIHSVVSNAMKHQDQKKVTLIIICWVLLCLIICPVKRWNNGNIHERDSQKSPTISASNLISFWYKEVLYQRKYVHLQANVSSTGDIRWWSPNRITAKRFWREQNTPTLWDSYGRNSTKRTVDPITTIPQTSTPWWSHLPLLQSRFDGSPHFNTWATI